MNQTFNINRFGLLLKRYTVENRKQLFFLFGVMWGVMLLAAACIGHYEKETIERLTANQMYNCFTYDFYGTRAALYLVSAVGFSCITGSYMFSSLRTKQSRIMSLMLPASMAEKYWVYFTVYILAFFPIFLLGTVVADLAYYVTAGGGIIFQLFAFHGSYSIFQTDSVLLWTVLCYQAIFALGSALWPRLSFFKTFIAMFVLSILALFFPTLIYHILKPFDDCVAVLEAIVVIACYSLAWVRFRHVQVIQKLL